MIALCPKCQHELEKDGCPACGWGKPITTLKPTLAGDLEPPVWVDLAGETRLHYESLIRKLARCSLLPFSNDKRFIRQLAEGIPSESEAYRLSQKQLGYLDDLQWKYRGQLEKSKRD